MKGRAYIYIQRLKAVIKTKHLLLQHFSQFILNALTFSNFCLAEEHGELDETLLITRRLLKNE